jgi:hypothetical protein
MTRDWLSLARVDVQQWISKTRCLQSMNYIVESRRKYLIDKLTLMESTALGRDVSRQWNRVSLARGIYINGFPCLDVTTTGTTPSKVVEVVLSSLGAVTARYWQIELEP